MQQADRAANPTAASSSEGFVRGRAKTTARNINPFVYVQWVKILQKVLALPMYNSGSTTACPTKSSKSRRPRIYKQPNYFPFPAPFLPQNPTYTHALGSHLPAKKSHTLSCVLPPNLTRSGLQNSHALPQKELAGTPAPATPLKTAGQKPPPKHVTLPLPVTITTTRLPPPAPRPRPPHRQSRPGSDDGRSYVRLGGDGRSHVRQRGALPGGGGRGAL